jgi:hypothetical protein
MSCLILGDSIALGLAAALGVNGTVCTVAALGRGHLGRTATPDRAGAAARR